MPVYSCEKCNKTFNQKGDYTKHTNRKIPCDGTNIIEKVSKLEGKVKHLEEIYVIPEYTKVKKSVDNIPIECDTSEEMSTSENTDESKTSLIKLWESKKHTMNTSTLKKVADILNCDYLSKIKKCDIIEKVSTNLYEKYEDAECATDELKQKLIKLFNIKSGSRSHLNNIDIIVKAPKKKTLKQEQPTSIKKTISENPISVDETKYEKKIEKKSTNPIHKLVDIMHNIMRDSESISGKKAYNDMIKLLCLRFIEPYLNGGLKYLIDYNYNINGEDLNQYKYLLHFNALHDEVKSKGDEVLEDTLYKIYDMLSYHTNFECIFKKKKTFNCSKGITLRKCIDAINTELDGYDFETSKSDIIGEIHEYFVNKHSKSNDAAFGQFFTPRTLINLTNKLYKELFPDNKPKSFYEPCMGTGGFIMGMYDDLSEEERTLIPGSSFHGIEREPDSYASGMLNLLLTFNPADANTKIPLIECKSSLINNSTKTYDRINTNPPFAVSIEYKELLSSIPDLKITESNNSNSEENDRVTMKTMYPIENNKADGFACFLQHCMFKLSENGVCSIVLPDGRFFTKEGKLQKMRKYLLENCVLKAVLNVPSGVFEHTGTSTAVLFFTKIQGQKTENVEFYMTRVDNANKCIGYEKLGDVSIDEIKKNDYVLSWSTYKPEILPEYKDVEWKTIGEICEFIPKSKRQASYGKKIGSYRFYTSSQNKKLFCDDADYTQPLLILGTGGVANIKYDTKFSCSADNILLKRKIDSTSNLVYMYYYLLSNIDMINNLFSGAGIKHINSDKVSKIKIPIPSIEKQNAIVEHCDKITELKNNAETAITTLESLAKTYHDDNICKMHHDGTEWKTIGEICEFNIGNTPSRNNLDYWGGKNKWVSVKELNNNIIIDTKEYITDLGVQNSSVKLFNINTILMSFKLSIGKMGIAGIPLYTNEAIVGINPKENSNINYLYMYYYLMNSDVSKMASGCIGAGNLNKTSISKIKISIPSIEKQNEMIEYYDFLHNAINEQKKIIKNYDLIIKNAISL
jgi:type I restriction-modification system DNA methylase subunit